MRAALLSVLPVVLPFLLVAQADTARGVIEGRVTDPSGRPVAEAEVLWQKGKLSVLTRDDGSFNLVVPARGVVVVLVRRPGFSAQALLVDLTRISFWRGSIVLQPGTFKLPDIEVTARHAKPAQYAATAKFDDFFRRQRLGLGTFISREDIEKSNAFHTIEILRGIAGVRADVRPGGDGAVAFARCSPNEPGYNVTVWIDGQRQYPAGGGVAGPTQVAEMISRISPTGIEMIEVFRGVSQIPAEYHIDGCAVIAIWTRWNRE